MSLITAKYCDKKPGIIEGVNGCECISSMAILTKSMCSCEYSTIPGADPSLTLKLSGDFRTCGILRFEQEKKIKTLNAAARREIETLRLYFR